MGDANRTGGAARIATWASGRAGTALAIACAAIVSSGIVLVARDGSRLKSLDETAFLDLSENLANHLRYAHTNLPGIEGYDPGLPAGALRPTAYRAPGYPLLLAPLRRLGIGLAGLRVLNFLLLALTVLLLHSLLARQSRTAALAGVALVFAYPVLFYAAGTLYPQTLAALLLLATIHCFDAIGRGSGNRTSVLAGLACGAMVLTVPLFIALVPAMLVWVRRSRRARLGQLAIVTGALVATLSPWIARNAVVFRIPAGLGTNSGFNLLAGNGPQSRYDEPMVNVKWPAGVRDQLPGKDEAERDRVMTRAAVAVVAAAPGRAAALYLKKFLYWFSFRNNLASDVVVPGGAGAGPGWLRDAVMVLSYGLLLGIALVRLALVRRIRPSSLEMVLLALYLCGGLAYAVYFTRIRFRLPFDWLLIALDATFLGQLAGAPAAALVDQHRADDAIDPHRVDGRADC